MMKHLSYRLRRFDDLHCHFRLKPLLADVLPFTAQYAGRGIAMPNTKPRAILTADDVVWYRREIEQVLEKIANRPSFEPLMTIEIRDTTTPQIVEEAFQAGAVAGKAYPLGVTTNSDRGLREFFNPHINETWRAMQQLGMRLLLHGELDQERVLLTKREEVFLPTLIRLEEGFPNLKIVLEHVSSAVGVNVVKGLGENVAATITAHHLCLTLNDVLGYGVQPHNACMPTPKDFTDRDELLAAATSGNPKFFLGSDTAPHDRAKKECRRGECGVFSAPVLPSVLMKIFEETDHLDRLENFTSRFGAQFYGLPLNEGYINLVRQPWIVPDQFETVVPFMAGQTLDWQLMLSD